MWVLSLTMWMGVDVVNVNSTGSESIQTLQSYSVSNLGHPKCTFCPKCRTS